MTPRFHDREMDPGQDLVLRQFAVALFRLVASYQDLERHRLTAADAASMIRSVAELHPSIGARSLVDVIETIHMAAESTFQDGNDASAASL